jgi:hypothetical protein
MKSLACSGDNRILLISMFGSLSRAVEVDSKFTQV